MTKARPHAADLKRLYRLQRLRVRAAQLPERTELLPGVLSALSHLQHKAETLLFASGDDEQHRPITVAVVGDFSSGKSTFLNALLGDYYCPVDLKPTTSAITYFSFGAEERILEEDAAGQLHAIHKETYLTRVQHHEHVDSNTLREAAATSIRESTPEIDARSAPIRRQLATLSRQIQSSKRSLSTSDRSDPPDRSRPPGPGVQSVHDTKAGNQSPRTLTFHYLRESSTFHHVIADRFVLGLRCES